MIDDLEGRVAVVTGAASGIGRALAVRLASEGMRVVAADVEEPPLEETVAAITAAGGAAVAHVCDVSDWDAVDGLREAADETYGPADLVANNAGVGGAGPMTSLDLATWQWTLGVNLWGVIHGITAFLPAMVERGSGHFVNTASIAGHLASGSMGPYNASKHAVVAISETLHHEMQQGATGVGVTCLCPGFVATNIVDSERNRPERYLPAGAAGQRDLGEQGAAIRDAYAAQLDPATVADQVVGAVRSGDLWLFTDDRADAMIRERHREIEERRTPGSDAHLLELMFGDS